LAATIAQQEVTVLSVENDSPDIHQPEPTQPPQDDDGNILPDDESGKDSVEPEEQNSKGSEVTAQGAQVVGEIGDKEYEEKGGGPTDEGGNTKEAGNEMDENGGGATVEYEGDGDLVPETPILGEKQDGKGEDGEGEVQTEVQDGKEDQLLEEEGIGVEVEEQKDVEGGNGMEEEGRLVEDDDGGEEDIQPAPAPSEWEELVGPPALKPAPMTKSQAITEKMRLGKEKKKKQKEAAARQRLRNLQQVHRVGDGSPTPSEAGPHDDALQELQEPAASEQTTDGPDREVRFKPFASFNAIISPNDVELESLESEVFSILADRDEEFYRLFEKYDSD